MERREAYYFGRVQGVGFRATAQGIASRYDVTGFVRNMPDGSVHLVVEGKADEIDELLDDMAHEMSRLIRSTEVRRGSATGEFADFLIRY
jgi:acylphosphatase